tara:strand:+ start:235 stop:564 length:330 start_codon:yes stop_codon:yes gene_type:complete
MKHLRTTTTVSLTVGELMLIVSLLGNTDPDDERHMVNHMLSDYPYKIGVQWPAHPDEKDLLRSEAFDAIEAYPGIYETMIKRLRELQYQKEFIYPPVQSEVVAGWGEEY